MPRTQPIITNFTAGELSPRMAGRVDHTVWANGCRTLENCFVWPTGPAERRPGTRFVAEVKDSAAPVRLLPFEYSTEQAYVIEAGPEYLRFCKDGGVIVDGSPAAPVEIATPWDAAALTALKWVQSADVVYLFSAAPPQKLSRSSHVDWDLAPVDWQDGPYLEENTDKDKKLQPSATTGDGITITATGFSPFAAGDVGRHVRIKHGSTWGYAVVASYVSATHVTADVRTDFGGTGASTAWRLGIWSDTTGWPTCGTFHQERLVLSGSKIRPHRLDGSKTGDFETFAPGTTDSDPWAYTIGSNQVNAVRWLESWRQLVIGTLGSVFRMGTDNANSGLTPSNVLVSREARRSAADMMSLMAAERIVFVHRCARRMFALDETVEREGLTALDLTLFADHVTAGGIIDWAYQAEPASILWAIRSDGVLIGCTYLPDQKVVAWHRHILGGDGRAEAIAVIPGETADEVWLVVRRTIGGQTRRYIEVLQPPFADDAALEDAWFVDCGLQYAGSPATVISGLEHLEGLTVHVLADGAVHPPCVVDGGSITLEAPASKVTVGLGYRSRLETMPIEAGQPEGTAQGRRRRVDRVTVRLLRSLGVRLGCNADQLEALPWRRDGDAFDAPVPLFTGDRQLATGSGWDNPTVWVESNDPLPMTVVALMPRITAHD